MENRTIWLEQRQSQQELLGGDDTYGNGGWECLGADCKSPIVLILSNFDLPSLTNRHHCYIQPMELL